MKPLFQIVLMRKTVPLAVRAIRQKILKTIHQLKARLKRHEGQQKAEQDAKLKEVEKKLKDKLKGKMKQIENIKIVEKDKDYISRLALRHDLKYFRKMLIVVSTNDKKLRFYLFKPFFVCSMIAQPKKTFWRQFAQANKFKMTSISLSSRIPIVINGFLKRWIFWKRRKRTIQKNF